MEMLRRMLIFRRVTTAYMSTNQTFAQMHPGITGFQAFLAPLGARRHLSDLIEMPTGIGHQVFPFLVTRHTYPGWETDTC